MAIAGQQKSPEDRALERTDLRRRQIFDAASRVFAAKGFHGATVQDVADEAGLGKGTIYEYVRSKKELLFLIVEEGEKLFHDTISTAFDENDPPEERLKCVLRAALHFFDDHRESMRTLVTEIEQLPPEDLIRVIENHKKSMVIITRIIDDGIASGVFASADSFILSKLMFMCVHYWDKLATFANAEKPVTIGEYEELLIAILFNGLVKR